jgi:hypothetical protein
MRALPESSIRMSNSRTATRILSAALAALALSVTAVAVAPPEAAEAQSGYRACGVFNSSTTNFPTKDGRPAVVAGGSHTTGTGLVTKVWMKGGDTCDSKLGFMKLFYDRAYPGSTAIFSFRMVRCEDFSTSIGSMGWDICPTMTVNKIYRMSSHYDALHPTRYPSVAMWAN